MFQSKILIVEDSPEMQLVISAALKGKYDIKCAVSSAQALKIANETLFDLLILDIELPDEDGFVLLSKIRMIPNYNSTPVFFLSGRSKTSDKVMGFSLGAEDYIVKPIDVVELQARVDSRIRRLDSDIQKEKFIIREPFRLDLERQKVFVRSEETEPHIELTPIEFKLLVLLVRKEERILSRNQILEEIWPNASVTDRTVDTHIYSLRKKLGSWGGCIEAVPRAGYRFVVSMRYKAS